MKKENRLRLCGARLNRFIYRFFIFIGMVALFSLMIGASAPGEERRAMGVLLIAGLSVGIVILWFSGRRQRELDRSQQLAAETALLFPYADAEELNHEYTLRKRREKRLEALFYLILALLAGVWFWAMYAAEASAASWQIGLLVIVPGLLIISAVLFILSVIPRVLDEEMPDVSKQSLELTRSMLRFDDPQREEEGVQTVRAVYLEEDCRTVEAWLQRERSQQRGNTLLLKFGMGFFVILPLILFGLSCIIAAAEGPKWFMLFSGILAVGSIALWVFMTHAPGGTGSAASASRRMKQLKSGQYEAIRDEILSYGMGDGAAEIEFARCGKVRFLCNAKTYEKYFCVPRHAAIVAKYKGRIQSVALLRDEDKAAPDTAQINETAPETVELETIMSDEAIHQAALREIERMSPSRRREMEVEIEQMFDQTDAMKSRSFLDLTTLEKGEWQASASRDLHRSNADITLNAIESYVMERLNVSRSAVMQMTKNPFAPSVRRRLLIAAAVGIGGALITAVIEKATGTSLGFVYLIISTLTGGIAMSCAESFSTMMKFRKLQKAYRDPKYRRKVLDAAVYREIREQVKQRRGTP